MHGTGPLFHRDPEGIADQCGNAGGADDLPRQLGQRLHGRNHVHDLKARLTAAHDGLLARDLLLTLVVNRWGRGRSNPVWAATCWASNANRTRTASLLRSKRETSHVV